MFDKVYSRATGLFWLDIRAGVGNAAIYRWLPSSSPSGPMAIAPSGPLTSMTLTLTWQGWQSAAYYRVRVTDVSTNRRYEGPLQAAYERQFVLPGGVLDVRATYQWQVIAFRRTGEAVTSNALTIDTSGATVPVPPVADLVVEGIQAPSSAPAGATVSLGYRVRNIGSGTASSSRVRVAINSSSTAVSDTDRVLDEVPIP